MEIKNELYEMMHSENAPLSYQSVDENGCFLDVNLKWLKTLGYDREEVIGKWFGDFLHPDSLVAFETNFPDFKIRGSVNDVQYKLRKKDNTYILVSFEGIITYTDDGSFKRTHCFFKDITKQVMLEKALIEAKEKAEINEAIFRNTLENSPIPTAVSDKDGNITFLNKQFTNAYGYTINDIPTIEKWYESAFTDEKVRAEIVDSWNKEVKRAVESKTPTKFREFNITCKNGETKIVSVSAFIDVNTTVALFQDITERKQIELELKESLERYKSLHNASFGGIVIHDKGLILECNQGLSNMTGYSLKELVGMDGLLLISPDDRDYVMERINSGYEKPYEAKGLHKSGREFPMRLEARNVPYKGKNVRTVEFRDITETKNAEIELQRINENLLHKNAEIEFNNQRLESLLNISQYSTDSIQELLDYALNEAIILTKSKIGYIYFYNEQTKQFTLNTWSKEVMSECMVMNPETFYDLDKTGCWGEAVRQKKPIIINDYQQENIYKRGTPHGHVQLNKFLIIPVIIDNRIVAVCGVANKETDYDNSDVRQLTLLMDSVWKISDRILIIRELKAAKERAEESDRLKSAFLANMSHEIRTPMNGILGFADLLKNPELTGEEQQAYIKIIEKSGNRMLNIINQIIDISKIEAGLMEMHLSESNINEQIEYVYTFFKPEAEAKNISISINTPLPDKEVTIKTDREKLYAILTNLVKNAVKYSHEGSIEIGYRLQHINPADMIEFYVRDTGIGIPKDRQEAVFERFIQADIADRMAYQGAGLGLAITKAYVEMLGGSIYLESETGKGSTFYFTLPYSL